MDSASLNRVVCGADLAHRVALLATIASLLIAQNALAQRVEDNAITQAGDIFGYSVADQSVGVYSSNNVRGSDPSVAGNIRIDGLYADGVLVNGHLLRSESIRVGLSALNFAFRAPSGIVDIQLAGADGNEFTSLSISDSQYTGKPTALWGGSLSLDFTRFSPDHRSSLSGGADFTQQVNANGGYSKAANIAFIPRLNFSSASSLTLIASYNNTWRQDIAPEYFFASTSTLPPQIERLSTTLPSWDTTQLSGGLFGGILEASLTTDWRLKSGLFYGYYKQTGYIDVFSAIASDDIAHQLDVISFNPHTHATEISGETRAERHFESGAFRTELLLNVRGRTSLAYYGEIGDTTYAVEQPVNTPLGFPAPEPPANVPDRDHVRQLSGGLSLKSTISEIGLVNVDVQRTGFDKSYAQPLSVTRTSYNGFLYGAEVGVKASSESTLYAAYTRGLEDSGVAPAYASNSQQVLAPSVTQQYEAGLRWSPSKFATILLGGFSLTRPYAGIDPSNYYRFLGITRQKGLELSCDSAIGERIHVLFGGYLLNAKINTGPGSGIGSRPLGIPSHDLQLNVDYALQFIKGLSLDTTIEHFGNRAANLENSVFVPSRFALSLGADWRTKFMDHPVSLRFSLNNALNNFGWIVNTDGSLGFNPPRSFLLSVRAEM